MALILIFVLVLVALGLSGTFYTMKKVTQAPVDSMLSIRVQKDQLNVDFLGLDLALRTAFFNDVLQTGLTGAKDIAAQLFSLWSAWRGKE